MSIYETLPNSHASGVVAADENKFETPSFWVEEPPVLPRKSENTSTQLTPSSEPLPPLQRQFSTAGNMYANVGDPITLQATFEGIRGGRWREPVERVRSATGSDYDKLKKGLFVIYPSVLMRGSNKAATSIDEYTGILVVDVDGKQNAPDLLEWAPQSLKGDQWVLGYHRSCGGKGLAVYFLVDSTQTEHAAAYKELEDRLRHLHDIIADPACINANRARYISYDPEAYLNPSAEVWSIAEVPAQFEQQVRGNAAWHEGEGHQIICAAIEAGVDLTTTEQNWFRLGKWVAQQYGDDGRELFHQLSQFHPEYSTCECDKKYTYLVRSLQTSDRRVTDNIPRIIAHECAPELLQAIKAVNVTKTHENIDKASADRPVSVAIDLSTKEAPRATTITERAAYTSASPIVPQSAPNRVKTPADLDKLLASTRYHHDPNFVPPRSVLSIEGERFATAGNFSVLVGLQKSGKGFVLSAIVAAYLRGEGGQCLSFKASPISGKPDVVIVDTEQDEGDLNTTTERLRRALTDEQFARLTTYAWRSQAPQDALDMLPRITANHPSAGLVIIDGIADLSPQGVNDDIGAREVAHRLKALTTTEGIHVVTVIHLNKGVAYNTKASDFSRLAEATVAGHLGINLQRKAETIIGVHKDREQRIHSVHHINSRGRDFAPFAFTISRPIDMPEHVSAMQYEAIAASAVTSPDKETATSIDIATHRELVADVFAVGDDLSRADLQMHIARVVGRQSGAKVSDRYARSFVAYWQAERLIEPTKNHRNPRQTWRSLCSSATPSAPAAPTPAEPALLQADPVDEARSKAIARKRKQGKRGGKNRLA